MEIEHAEPDPQMENVRVLPADLAARWLQPGDETNETNGEQVRRLCIDVRGHSITLLAFDDGRLLAIDTKCYHLGGPLGQEGDIEDLVLEPGSPPEAVIRCPWHGRTVRLSSGQCVDVHLDGTIFFSDTPVQRTYLAYREADGAVHMLWPLAPKFIPSDLVNGPTPRAPISSSVAHAVSKGAGAHRAEVMRQRQREHHQHASTIQRHCEATQVRQYEKSAPGQRHGIATPAERSALVALYSKHRPDKLPNLETLIAKYGGQQLLAAAREKYGLAPPDKDGVTPIDVTPAKRLRPAAAGMAPIKAAVHTQTQQDQIGAKRQMCVRIHMFPAKYHIGWYLTDCPYRWPDRSQRLGLVLQRSNRSDEKTNSL